MLREKTRALTRLVIATDFLLVFSGYLIAKFIHCQYYGLPFHLDASEAHSGLVASGIIVFCLKLNGIYEAMRRKGFGSVVRQATLSVVEGFMAVLAAMFVLKYEPPSRLLVLVFFAAAYLIVLGRWSLLKYGLSKLRIKGYNNINILIVGADPLAIQFAKEIEGHRHFGIRVMGFLSRDMDDIGKIVRRTGGTIIGTFEDLDVLLRSQPIDEVVFAVSEKEMSWGELRDYLYVCEEYGVKMSILSQFFNMRFAKLKVSELGKLNFISFETYNAGLFPIIVKRAFDASVSLLALILLSPGLAAIALAIRLDSKGPILFRQKRCGLNGRIFEVLKFRTMCVDAEERKEDLMAQNEMDGPTFKMKNDPRITRVGSLLRKYSFDEFPQLINVLSGEMSLVGPRPPLPSEVEQYERWQRRRLSVRPGITCTWQVSGRNNIGFEDWMRLDLEYIDNWSLRLDIELLLKTLPAVMKATGM